MNLLKNSIVFIILITVFSCAQSKKETVNTSDTVINSSSIKIQTNNSKVFFEGTGTTPDWNVILRENEIQFSLKDHVFHFPLPHVNNAADANIKIYSSLTKSAHIRIKIAMQDCPDANAKIHPYAVSIDFKQASDTDFTSYKGCGEYVTDYRLHDIWVLETMANDTVSVDQFTKELPNIEINAKANSFLGYAGCNTMNGSIFSEQSKIRFTNIVITKKMCLPTNKEALFLKALEHSTQFKIENNRLYLSNPDENTLTFKKVD
ncbi:META domain-containing protein [uncultured Formosa sp.]|uniref:META domain-containing protein n=1 Tax=uncultured Formosa sp. TaxID=255435 RepID=UPI00262C53A7|nr:META domain-containing protein [uncultured Formosa sp.]